MLYYHGIKLKANRNTIARRLSTFSFAELLLSKSYKEIVYTRLQINEKCL